MKEIKRPKIAVLVPCLNEELTIASVVSDFKKALLEAEIYVFDNLSTDKTAEVAKNAGANVVCSPLRGKGNVVKHMFSSVDADIYLMVDGDSTYPAEFAPNLIKEFHLKSADMVVGTRMSEFETKSFRKFHLFGNHLVAWLISFFFKTKVTDVLSGYRVFSNRLVKSLPLMSEGFDIETELTLQSAAKGFLIHEVPIKYGQRPQGSTSKLNTYTDGFLVLKAIFTIFKDYKPLVFFSSLAFVLACASLVCGYKPIQDYYVAQYVYHVPLAILAAALGILATLTFAIGLILHTVGKYHQENFELWKRLLTKKDQI